MPVTYSEDISLPDLESPGEACVARSKCGGAVNSAVANLVYHVFAPYEIHSPTMVPFPN